MTRNAQALDGEAGKSGGNAMAGDAKEMRWPHREGIEKHGDGIASMD